MSKLQRHLVDLGGLTVALVAGIAVMATPNVRALDLAGHAVAALLTVVAALIVYTVAVGSIYDAYKRSVARKAA